MPYAVAGAVGAIGGALISGNAAESAAQTQANAATQAAQVQQNMFQTTQQNAQPYIGAGQIAIADILNGLNPIGIGSYTVPGLPSSGSNSIAGSIAQTASPSATAAPTNASPDPTIYQIGPNQYRNSQGNVFTGSPSTGLLTSNSSPNIYTASGSGSPTLDNGAINPFTKQPLYTGKPLGSGAPYTLSPSGPTATSQSQNTSVQGGGSNQIVPSTAPGSLLQQQYVPFTAANLQNTPGYQFTLQQGLNGITNAMSRSGGANSNNLEGLIGYNQGLAGTTYQQQLGDYMSQFQQENAVTQQNLNNLLSLAQLGENAGQGLGNQSVSAGGNIGNNIVGAGQSTASGIVGQSNALTSGLSNAYNNYAQQQYLSNLNNQGAASSDSGSSLDSSQIAGLSSGGGGSIASYFPQTYSPYGFSGTYTFGQ